MDSISSQVYCRNHTTCSTKSLVHNLKQNFRSHGLTSIHDAFGFFGWIMPILRFKSASAEMIRNDVYRTIREGNLYDTYTPG